MKTYDIVIIGAGAAGLTAGIYAARAKKSVLILEKTAPGGQILESTKVENYPGLDSVSGVEFGQKLKAQVEKFGGELKTAEVEHIEKTGSGFMITTDDGDFSAKSVILANGSREKHLGLEGEEEFVGKGVSYCATCDGALYKDKSVAVYGGGNTAAYSVLYLANLCEKVYWIFRKPAPRAEAHLVEKIKALKNVEICSNTTVEALEDFSLMRGANHGNLACIRTHFQPKRKGDFVLDDNRSLDVDCLFVLIGREPDNEKYKNLVALDVEGYIESDETCTTSQKGVFCAGDTRKKPLNQLITAAADGAVAASEATRYLDEHSQNWSKTDQN